MFETSFQTSKLPVSIFSRAAGVGAVFLYTHNTYYILHTICYALQALNAKQCCEKFEIDADALDKMWGVAKKSKNLVKFGGGFYCAKLEKDGKRWLANYLPKQTN